ncbi:MAG: 1-acyl-sn-glycerol-3-phosphate acyltransferase [Clostridia bacterium]|nr:1-acyl-sn-glycerol-3-phosphate acyltransferase [Clostridia bacterium]
MKIKTKRLSYDEVMALPRPQRKKPLRPLLLFRLLVRVLSQWDLMLARFRYTGTLPDEPSFVLMNHSSFIDLKIAHRILFPRPFGIVCTSDGLVGKRWLMRQVGCIPTRKFVSDLSLISDIRYLLKEKKTSVLMYPEASYSFDGCATPLPRRMGVIFKKLDVPVVYIRTYGAFTRDPLYNGLQLRKVPVTATVETLLSREDLQSMSVEEIDAVLDRAFTFDHFAWQKENEVKVTEAFRADGLERILYRCAHCGAEGGMEGKGTSITCHHCGKTHEMDEFGQLHATDGDTRFSHIPDWYEWERQEVRRELETGTYELDTPVEIAMMVDYKAIYRVGTGRLIHNKDGFVLTGCDGKLHYTQKPQASYGLYADYFWYEIGDVICIGDKEALYYCFPADGVPVAKARQAAEELFKLTRQTRQRPTPANA